MCSVHLKTYAMMAKSTMTRANVRGRHNSRRAMSTSRRAARDVIFECKKIIIKIQNLENVNGEIINLRNLRHIQTIQMIMWDKLSIFSL